MTDRHYLLVFWLAAAALWVNVVVNWDPTLGLEAEAPVGVALLLFVWLGAPWRFEARPVRCGQLLAGALVFAVGLARAWTAVGVLGWNLALWAWLGARLAPDSRRRAWSLALLPLLAWPWLKADCHFLEVALRHVEAFALQTVLRVMDVSAVTVGTSVCTPRASIDIIDECAGLNMLHALLILGTVLARYQRRLVPMATTIAKVALLAVLANVLRIVFLGVLAVHGLYDSDSIPLHNFTGVMALLVLSAVAFSGPMGAPVLRPYVPEGPAYDL